MIESGLARKLQLKPGQKAVVINAPDGFVEQLGFPVGLDSSGEPEGTVDFLQIFVRKSSDLEKQLPEALRVLKHDGLFWITYPKGSSKMKTDLNRDKIWKDLEKYNLAGVAMVAIDAVWSAMRFRPAEKVRKRS